MNEPKPLPEEVDLALKVYVERAVRPVQAESARKKRMRRELYAHLNETFARERLTSSNNDEALRRSLNRVGDPEDLSIELNEGVPWPERRVHALGMAVMRQPSESIGRHALRLAGYMLVQMSALFLLIWLIDLGGGPPRSATPRVAAVITGLYAVCVLIGAYCGGYVRETIKKGQASARSVLLATRWAVAGGFLLQAVGLLVIPAIAWPGVLWSGNFLLPWTCFSATCIPFSLLAAWIDVRQSLELEEWRSLEIE